MTRTAMAMILTSHPWAATATLAIARARGAIGAIIMRGILVVAAGGIEAMVCGTVVILGAMGDTRTVRTAGGRAGMVIIIIIIIIRRR